MVYTTQSLLGYNMNEFGILAFKPMVCSTILEKYYFGAPNLLILYHWVFSEVLQFFCVYFGQRDGQHAAFFDEV